MIIQKSNLKSQSHSAKAKTELKYCCYHFSIATIKFLGSLPNTILYRPVKDQLMRSATSVGANIVEAKSSSSRRDFIKFYEIALKSANETKYWLGLLRDGLGEDKVNIQELLLEIDEISRMLGSSLLTLKKKKF